MNVRGSKMSGAAAVETVESMSIVSSSSVRWYGVPIEEQAVDNNGRWLVQPVSKRAKRSIQVFVEGFLSEGIEELGLKDIQ
jgi:hypothetical protein